MIQELRGKYRPLSNFWSCFIVYRDIVYPSVENAYQAAKMKHDEHRVLFEHCKASEAKQLGSVYPMRDDWNSFITYPKFEYTYDIQTKIAVMYELVFSKFEHDMYLKQLLLDTGDEQIEEGNWWGDKFWGTVNGKGENWLGRILMKVREELRRESV